MVGGRWFVVVCSLVVFGGWSSIVVLRCSFVVVCCSSLVVGCCLFVVIGFPFGVCY